MLVKVNAKEFQFLRTLEVETYGDTFGAYISDDDLEDYYQTVLSPEQVQQDLNLKPILFLIMTKKFVVFSSLTGERRKQSLLK